MRMVVGSQRHLWLCIGLIFCCLTLCQGSKASRPSKKPKTSPRIVAQRTGAARFEEYLDDDSFSSHEGKLKKRLAVDTDVLEHNDNDYEVYQGVLGRPGVDFPVMTGIPKTNFNCKEFGNGYFADLDTSCQVFHICDEGRKISFLCPNGTIFRQIDLICDWWFKVDCAAAPGHYAESSEQLHRAQRLRQQKLRHIVHQNFDGSSIERNFKSDAKPAESVAKPAVKLPIGRGFQTRSTVQTKTNRRMDFSAEDLVFNSNERQTAHDHPNQKRRNRVRKQNVAKTNSQEQELISTAESASFVKSAKQLNGYNYPVPDKTEAPIDTSVVTEKTDKVTGYDYPTPDRLAKKLILPSTEPTNNPTYPTSVPKQKKNNYMAEPKPFNTRPTEKTEIYTSTFARLRVAETTNPSPIASRVQTETATQFAPTTMSKRGSTTYQSSLKKDKQKTIQQKIQTSNAIVNNEFKTTTASYDGRAINTYSTARKPSTKNKETPFYTPTIPAIANRQSKLAITTELPITTTSATNTDEVKHAMEMIESLKELDIEAMTTDAEKYLGQRPGLEVPPSSGPSALHSLALYFATNDSITTKRQIPLTGTSVQPTSPSDEEETSEASTVGITSVFLSDKTVNEYEALFHKKNTPEIVPTTIKYEMDSRVDDDVNNDLDGQHSKNPAFAAAGSPQLRELAQVFTHALSAYLQDPETFRKILSEIRPTEPPPVLSNEIPYRSSFTAGDDFQRQESKYPIPGATTAAPTATIEDLEVLDFSDVTISTRFGKDSTESLETSTTTELSSTTPNSFSSETFPPISTNLVDRTPGSRQLTSGLERVATARQSKALRTESATQGSFRLADEINGGLVVSTLFPYDDSRESTNNDTVDYFPILSQTRTTKKDSKPYGADVKPSDSTPIQSAASTPLPENKARNFKWGDEISTIRPVESNAFPSLFSELLPPLAQNKSNELQVPSDGILPPFEDSEEGLQRSQSQSFIGSRNAVKTEVRKSKTYYDYLNYDQLEANNAGSTKFGQKLISTTPIQESTTIKGHYVTKSFPTSTLAPEVQTLIPESVKTTLPDTGSYSNSKTTLSYAVFLDPLTINDGLMDSFEDTTITPSPNTYLPRTDITELEENSITTTPSSTRTSRRGRLLSTTPSIETLDSDEITEPLQKRANFMFGNLNDTQADHLMNVMKKADKNKTVKRLILLLIQTCDDDYNKTVEESRTAILNALIGMDSNKDIGNLNGGDFNDIQVINTKSLNRRGKSIEPKAATTEIPQITTYRSANHNKFTSSSSSEATSSELDLASTSYETSSSTPNYSETTPVSEVTGESSTLESRFSNDEADIPSTTNFVPQFSAETTTETQETTTETTTLAPSTTSKPKFRLKPTQASGVGTKTRTQKNVRNEDFFTEPESIEHKHADARALELLRSLYSLASRWGRK